MLLALFDRRYTLRTRLFTAVQPIPVRPAAAGLKDACRLPGCLLPVIVYILQQTPGEDWGRSFYPFVRENSPCIPLQELGVVREDALLPDGFLPSELRWMFSGSLPVAGQRLPENPSGYDELINLLI